MSKKHGWLKRKLRAWLLNDEDVTKVGEDCVARSGIDFNPHGIQNRSRFEVFGAQNGYVVMVTTEIPSRGNGPPDFHQELRIIPEGSDYVSTLSGIIALEAFRK